MIKGGKNYGKLPICNFWARKADPVIPPPFSRFAVCMRCCREKRFYKKRLLKPGGYGGFPD